MPAEKSEFKPSELGKSHRSYDDIEEGGDNDSLEKMLELLQWARPPRKKKIKKKNQQATADDERKNAIFKTLEELEKLAKEKHLDYHHAFVEKGKKIIGEALKAGPFTQIAHVKKLKEASMLDRILSAFSNTVEDIYDATRDFFTRKKVKTSLMIVGCIALFATVGVLAAPFVPALAVAVGPTIGPIIIAAAADIGGAIGLGVIFGAIGSWIGKTLSKKIFKYEKRFELSQKITDQIQKNTGVAPKEAQMISAYLYNRYHTVQNEKLRSAYKNLRTLAIKRANPDKMKLVARFFCVELQELKRQVRRNPNDAKLQSDLAAVIHILKHFERDGKIAEFTRDRVRYLLGFYEDIDAKKANLSKKTEPVTPAVPGVHAHFPRRSQELDKDKVPQKPTPATEPDHAQKKSPLKPKPPYSPGSRQA